ncbi:MAG: thioredoxin fold domain-containing protein [Planctomycetota bacterium]|jgi:thioredoxin 1
MGGLEELADGDSKRRRRWNKVTIRGLGEKKTGRNLSRLFVFGFAGLVVCGAALCFWPTIKGSRKTPSDGAEVKSDLKLSGVLYTEDNPLAVVNTEIVHEGDVIDGARVVEISRRQVEFEKSGRRWIQRLPDMDEGVSSGGPVLLQLGSQKCPPCRQMKPILDKLRSKYAGKFKTKYIDVRKDRAAGEKYGARAIPTQIFYDSEGREVFRHVGFYSEKEILAAWEKLGVKL